MQKINRRNRKALIVITLISSCVVYIACNSGDSRTGTDAVETGTRSNAGELTISPGLPAGLGDSATLEDAAAFAWQEFIALNWPAVAQAGQANTRDMADASKFFGDQSGPLVWHTYRSKAEIYPWSTHYPNGSSLQGDTLLVFNYDALPQYQYKDSVPPCAAAANDVAWINLDESSEISLNFMFAGQNPKAPTANNSSPQLIRFLAKGNRQYFNYVTGKNYFNHGGSYYSDVQTYTNAIKKDTVTSDSTIVFPEGTIMVKAAWRLLTAKDNPAHFHTTKVRYYETKNGNPCYYQENTWGLVALHIVRKTSKAPYFTFATFEQQDNILTPDGKPVEDADGNVINPFTSPTTPAVLHTDSPNDGTATKVAGPYCDTPGNRLFYINTAPGLPDSGNICVNGRYNNIPPAIINANKAAHQAIKAYNSTHKISNSPWEYYKLVNIQYQPFNASQVGTDANKPVSTYRQANIVVETNYTLQMFAGQQIATGSEAGQTSNYAGGQPFYNIHIPNGATYTKINMGGCMGCHGNAQAAGTDFSFMLRGGPVIEPDVPAQNAANKAKLARKYRFP